MILKLFGDQQPIIYVPWSLFFTWYTASQPSYQLVLFKNIDSRKELIAIMNYINITTQHHPICSNETIFVFRHHTSSGSNPMCTSYCYSISFHHISNLHFNLDAIWTSISNSSNAFHSLKTLSVRKCCFEYFTFNVVSKAPHFGLFNHWNLSTFLRYSLSYPHIVVNATIKSSS